jgi:hypothetical protein
MKALALALGWFVATGCAGSRPLPTTPPAEPAVAVPGPLAVTITDKVGGHDAQLRAAVRKHLDTMPDVAAAPGFELAVALVALETSPQTKCKVTATLGMAKHGLVATTSASATVDSTEDAAVTDCLDASVAQMLDRHAVVIRDRIGAHPNAEPARAVLVLDFAGDTLEASRLDTSAAPAIWARARAGDYAAARDAFAAAMLQDRRQLRAWLVMSLLAGDAAAQIAGTLDRAAGSPREHAEQRVLLWGFAREYGSRDQARDARALVLADANVDAEIASDAHRIAATEAVSVGDWAALDAEVGALIAAAKSNASLREEVAEYVEEMAHMLHVEYERLRDRARGAAARSLYARAAELVDAARVAKVRELAAELDARLQAADDSHIVVRRSTDKTIVRRYIKRRADELEGCYARALIGDPDLAGTVTLRLTIGPAGNVVTATVDETGSFLRRVPACIVDRAFAWKFPPSDAVTKIVYPLTFRPLGS